MGRGDDDLRDHRHRDDFQKEEEEELEEQGDDYDDLITAGVDNNQMAATAEATRAFRAAQDQEQEQQDQLDDMFEALDDLEFIGAPPPMETRDRSTADEDEESSPLAAPDEPNEEDEPLPGARASDNWVADSADALASPAATEAFVSSSDWLKSE